ncbi:peptidase inhibitor family I36 protein [Streptomyces coeruleofuscus]|uniref:Secreted protein n=1 Tax=Streptomyces coeruleofuscus TaxID=66879 RepID=A0ABP5VCU2_9ACTN
MRKLTATLATLTLAGLGALVPAASVQAAPTANCDDNYEEAKSGYMYAYRLSYCESYLGSSKEWDENWGNSSRSFQGDDDNRATSLLNKTGKYVAFYRLKDYKGGHICIASDKKYVSSLKSDDVFSNGETADNRISSHKKLASNTCSKFMD